MSGSRVGQGLCDHGRHAGVVFQQRDVGGAAFFVGQFADPGQQEGRDFFAAHPLGLRLLQRLGDGGFRHVRGQLVFRRHRGGDQRAGAKTELFARAQDGGDVFRGVAADVEGQAGAAGVKAGNSEHR